MVPIVVLNDCILTWRSHPQNLHFSVFDLMRALRDVLGFEFLKHLRKLIVHLRDFDFVLLGDTQISIRRLLFDE